MITFLDALIVNSKFEVDRENVQNDIIIFIIAYLAYLNAYFF